jgi:hypothetical protein
VSTFATTVWIDLPPDGPISRVAAELDGLRNPAVVMGAPAERVWIAVEPDWIRLSTYLSFGSGLIDQISALVASAGRGRAAVAEDNDEYGACWVVLAAEDGVTRTVHRRYILNASPRRGREVKQALKDFVVEGQLRDPRADDVPGAPAATEAALLFGVDPRGVVDAEARSDTAFEGLGVVGGPFPWKDAMGLTWPGPDAGRAYGV